MNYQNYQNLMRLTSSDTKRTLLHLFLYQRELFSICAQNTQLQFTFHALQSCACHSIDCMHTAHLAYCPDASILVYKFRP